MGIGASMGLCAFVVDLALEILNSWKFDSVKSAVASDGGFWPPYLAFLFFNMGFSALSGCLVAFVAPLAAGSGIPEIKSYLNGVRLKGALLSHPCSLSQSKYGSLSLGSKEILGSRAMVM